MQRNRFLLSALCLLATLSFPLAQVHARYQEEISPETRLQQDLDALEAAAPRLDAETRQYLPVFQDVLRRVYLDRDSVTESELQLVRALKSFLASRAINPGEDLKPLKSQLSTTPGIRSKPEVLVSQRRTPGGRRAGVVMLKVGSQKKTVAEIVASAGGYNPGQRAEQVARRLRLAYGSNPLWWTQAHAGTIGKDYVVTAPQAPGGYIITADANYARERGLSREALARRLVSDIRETYDKLASGGRDARALSPDEQKEMRRQQALDLRQEGDGAYDRGDTATAERMYRKSREADPTYIAAYRRLADLYAGQKKTAQRRAILRQALAQPGLDPTERSEIERMLR